MYAKLFTSIYCGTLRGNSRGLLVFTNLLAHCDKSGCVDMHPRAIADEIGLSIDEVRAALLELEKPDPESRSPEEEGRRIVRLDEHRAWGWIVVNYVKYRAIRDESDRREQNRIAQAKWRKNNKPQSASVSQNKPQSAHTEADTDTEKRKRNTTRAARTESVPEGLETVSDQVRSDWIALRKAKRAAVTATAIRGIKREADKAGVSLETALATSCARGWTGFKADWLARDATAETPWQRGQRERMEQVAPRVASQRQTGGEIIDVGAPHGPALGLD